ncbi:MAG: ATP-dependent DNA helicase PcrA [Erysipelotrichaceae bacterium]|nr:ATP-dependent DNA helicase PcrA [Erysipelotrichaceae bacterium]
MDLLTGLNESQRKAVVTTEGPVMVMAGAGSGKTKVLTTRIAYLISELGIPSSNILAVTFTNKAANEMKERIESMLSIETKYMWVSTFHSFCSRLLRLEMNHLPPFTKSFVIIDDEDSNKIVKDIMKEEMLDEYKPKDIRSLISKSKNFTDFKIEDPRLNNAYSIVDRKYHEYLKDNNLLDFDDLIIKTIELFKKNPDILEKYQNKFQYILVDEFQDTNTLQYNLVFMLSARYHNIFVVGDDFQSIYSFRGARIENINRFRNSFLEHQLILLEENYRSTTQILDLANSIIEHNPNQIKKKMYSSKTDGQIPFYYHADSAYDEVMFVIDKIKELMVCGDSYSDFAILYRANYISRNFEDMLVRYQIPYKIYGGLSFFARKEIKDIIAYLRLLINKDDDFSFRRIINEPKRKVGPALLEKLSIEASSNGVSLYNAILTISGSGLGISALREFKAVMDTISAQIENVKLGDLVDSILNETGYEEALKKDEDTYHDRIGNVKELKSVLREAEEFYDGDNTAKLEQLLSDLALRTDNEDDDISKDNCVRLSTYHQVKGLEFKNVFMVAMEDGIFPSANCMRPDEIEEERRICYVGITRAKAKLYITNAENRFLFGCHQHLPESRFINEMTKTLFKNISKGYTRFDNNTVKKSSLKVLDKPTEKEESSVVKFSVGDKINHKAFGDGLVVAVEGDVIQVAFKVPHGIKKLMGSHPAIRKI